jgi:outer membrane protein
MQHRVCRTLLATILLCVSLGAAADAVTDRAKQLLDRHDAEAAYKLLLPLEAQRAGDPEFDYLLGIAALDAGDRERAVFALERVLAVQPDNLRARAEIARAYLAGGEREAAKREFEAVRARQVPAEVRATIDRFLSAIAAAEHTRVDSYLELAFGYDTNVTSATPNSTIAIPVQGQHFAVDTSRYRMTGGLNVTGSGSACLSSCIAYVQGFFAGTTAERAGLGYQVSDFQAGKNIIGAAAFTR